MTTTPTLGLTQFEATDTINFLTQYNTDLSKIDTNAKMTKAIGSDYIYSYTTAPSYSGGTITVYSGTKYVCADGRDANGDIKQTIVTISTNKTLTFATNQESNVFLDNVGSIINVVNANCNVVDFISQLPSTVGTTSTYITYVINEHKYYRTSGSTTANWQPVNYCKVASVKVVSGAITYFKPNLQLNLAQKIGKDKLLMTMADVNANTDKEFVPSAVAVKELLATLGVDYVVERGSNANGYYEKWNSGKLVMWGQIDITSMAITGVVGSIFLGTYIQNLPVTSLTTVNAEVGCFNNVAAWAELNSNTPMKSSIGVSFYRPVSGTVPVTLHYHAIGTWK